MKHKNKFHPEYKPIFGFDVEKEADPKPTVLEAIVVVTIVVGIPIVIGVLESLV